ncbi:MAG: STAS domain-containing protein [Clostridiales bacterium]|jgi:anti-sigma B factor antagonist|nr:STAS domain-containing protein [Clostridiales bacterium]
MDHSITSLYDEEGKVWNVELSGEFDIFNSSELKNSLSELVAEKNADLNLDCAKVKFVDSTALGSLVAVLKNVKAYGGKIVLSGLRPNILRLFKITNLDRVFEIAGDINGN